MYMYKQKSMYYNYTENAHHPQLTLFHYTKQQGLLSVSSGSAYTIQYVHAHTQREIESTQIQCVYRKLQSVYIVTKFYYVIFPLPPTCGSETCVLSMREKCCGKQAVVNKH